MKPVTREPVESGRISRRSLITKSLLGSAVLFVGGTAGLALRPGRSEPLPGGPLQALDASSFPVLAAFIEAVAPTPMTVPAAQVALIIDDRLTYVPAAIRKEFNLALGLLENGLAGMLTRGSVTPFTLQDLAGRRRSIDAWRDSRFPLLVGAYHALRKISLAAYYMPVDIGAEAGYPGPPIPKPDPGPIRAREPLSPPMPVAAAEKGEE